LEARDRAPLSSHAGWAPASDRPDPVGLLQEQNRSREPTQGLTLLKVWLVELLLLEQP
jgi:hypothetical protein